MKHVAFFMLVLLVTIQAKPQAPSSVPANERISEVRSVPDSVANNLKKHKDFRYANDLSYWKKEKPDNNDGFARMIDALAKSIVFKVILYSLIIAIILYVLYQVMVVNNFFILSRGKRKKVAAANSTEEVIPENIEEKIDEAVSKGEFRLGIRYMYLRTLKLLSDRGIIALHAKSTNQEYIRQLSRHHHPGKFRTLTHIYEYVWYGEFEPTASQFAIIQDNFNQFNPSSSE